MRRGIAFGALAFVLLAGSAQAATTLYVNGSTGSDTSTCGPESSPCKTIEQAIGQGESLSPPVTVDVSAGTYDEGLGLSSLDSGLTIDGAGDGTNPATATIIVAPSASPVIDADSGSAASSLNLEHLTLSEPNGEPAVLSGATAVTTTDVDLDVTGDGLGYLLDGGSLVSSGGSITLSNSSAGSAIDLSGANANVQLTGTPVSYAGDEPAILADAVTLASSPLTVTNTTVGAPAINSSSGSVTVTDSPIDYPGDAAVISAAGPLTVSGSQLTSQNTGDGSPVIDDSGSAVSVSGAPIVDDGTGEVVVGDAADLSDVQITQSTPGAAAPTLNISGGPSTLSKVTITSASRAPLVVADGSISIAGSTIASNATTDASPALDITGSTSTTSDVSLTDTKVTQVDESQPIADISDANAAFDSSELLGGLRTIFSAGSGETDTLTIASSTIDVGQLGVRDSVTDGFASVFADGGSSGTDAVINVEGSILVEAPEVSGDASVNCSYTEVPFPTTPQAGVNCGDTDGNTYTPSLSAIFQDPGVSYAPNPSWNGVDSVPAAAISLPAPFADSSTDVLGNPRVVNGEGTCTPGIRDKGAIELQGHSGVVPAPTISGPADTFTGVRNTYTVTSPNIASSVSLGDSWTSSDKSSGSGKSFAHKFARAGRYTVSVTVTGAADCAGHASKTVTVVGTDAITKLAVSPKTVKAKLTISYRASAVATTTLTIEIKTRKGYKVVKRLTHHDKAGKVRLTVRRGKLKAGHYRLEARSKNGAGKSKPAYVTFTVKG